MAKGAATVCKLNKKAPILDGGNSYTTKRNSINSITGHTFMLF
jgi:hypothetical protein